MRILSHTVLFLLILMLGACTIDTVEQKNDLGQKERFERRKKDGAKHGLYQRFFDDGTLAETATYVNDTLQGERRFYYPSGKVESLEHYRNGVLDGAFQKYSEKGNLVIQQQFVDGAMEGLSLRYYPNGQLEEQVTIVHNEENGPFVEYYENGNKKAEGTYAPDGEGFSGEQGELREYDEQGELVRKADCIMGNCRTIWKKE
ncbi:MAG: toxin-antitoxin system YwqK family antitoxin [Lewinellaceae bacterium]|nr:toxin-antitoxin system YwqK family antitoxin [Lewinellaceae bacterium]